MPPDTLRGAVAEGLLYAHSRLNENTRQNLESASFLYALVELLAEKGVIGVEELDGRQQAVRQRLLEQFRRNGTGTIFQDPEYDKYNFDQQVEIDCASRVHLCRAACCKLPFALSKQDIREGIVQWDLGQPYLIDQGADGYCRHMARGDFHCAIHANRPVPCRGFDCRQDHRIWLDFDERVVNPAIHAPDWPKGTASEAAESQPATGDA